MKNYDPFSLLRDQCKIETEICNKKYMESVEESIGSDPKFFWKFINDSKIKKGLPYSMHMNRKNSNDPHEIADMYRQYYSQVYKTSIAEVSNISYEQTVDLMSVAILPDKVLRELNSLKETNDSGPDEISSLFLKRCSGTLADPLCSVQLFSEILNCGRVVSLYLFISPGMLAMFIIRGQFLRAHIQGWSRS